MSWSRLLALLRGRTGWLISVFFACSYLAAAFFPFRLDLPRRVINGAAVNGDNVRFESPGIVRTGGPPVWLQDALSRQSLSVAVTFRSFASQQFGPARIFTLSENQNLRNLTIGQDGDDLIVRLRTTATSLNGRPDYYIRDVFRELAWRQLQVEIRPGRVRILVDGRLEVNRPLPRNGLDIWNPRYCLALGNELNGRRAWLGEIRHVEVHVGDRTYAGVEQLELRRPDYYWAGVRWEWYVPWKELLRSPKRQRDLALNFICFIPLGFVVASSMWKGNRLLRAVAGCSAISLFAELVQIGIDDRFPSMVDWILNSLGGLVGAMFAVWAIGLTNLDRANAHAQANGLPETAISKDQ